MLNFPTGVPSGTLFPDPMVPGTLQWKFDGVKWQIYAGMTTASIPDADHDGKKYGRKNRSWNEALPIEGGTVTGALNVTGTITSSGAITSPFFKTTLGGNTEFAFHQSGNYIYVDFNDGVGWRVLATEQRIWDVCRHVINNENPAGGNAINSMRLTAVTVAAHNFSCPGGVTWNVWNAYFSGYAPHGRYLQHHIPNQGWILSQWAN